MAKEKEPKRPSENDAQIAAPKGTLTLGERTLLLNQPTPQDIVSIMMEGKKFHQTSLAKLTDDPAFDTLPTELKSVAVKVAVESQMRGPNLSPFDAFESLARPRTLAFAVWLMARKNHPELKLEEVRALITEDNAMAVLIEFSEASGMAALGNAAGRSGSTPSLSGASSSSE